MRAADIPPGLTCVEPMNISRTESTTPIARNKLDMMGIEAKKPTGLTCDQHRSALHGQQLNRPPGCTDQDEAASQKENAVECCRKNLIRRGPHKDHGQPHSGIPAFSERPQQGEDVHSAGGSKETGSTLHPHTGTCVFASLTRVLNNLASRCESACSPAPSDSVPRRYVTLLPTDLFSETCFVEDQEGRLKVGSCDFLLAQCLCQISYLSLITRRDFPLAGSFPRNSLKLGRFNHYKQGLNIVPGQRSPGGPGTLRKGLAVFHFNQPGSRQQGGRRVIVLEMDAV